MKTIYVLIEETYAINKMFDFKETLHNAEFFFRKISELEVKLFMSTEINILPNYSHLSEY